MGEAVLRTCTFVKRRAAMRFPESGRYYFPMA
jgi:hypothetical protein